MPVFVRRWSKSNAQYTISDMLCCESVANSSVFSTLAFLGGAKMFLFLVRAESTVNYGVLGAPLILVFFV